MTHNKHYCKCESCKRRRKEAHEVAERYRAHEQWKPVRGYEGLYDVSHTGNIYSVLRRIILRPETDNKGYQFICLCKDRKQSRYSIHRLVADAFLGPIPDKMEINHKDGNKKHNVLDNLEIVTRSQNIVHRVRVLGIVPLGTPGEKNHNSVLTEKDVLTIRKLKQQGYGASAIAKQLGFGLSCISHVYYGRSWSHI